MFQVIGHPHLWCWSCLSIASIIFIPPWFICSSLKTTALHIQKHGIYVLTSMHSGVRISWEYTVAEHYTAVLAITGLPLAYGAPVPKVSAIWSTLLRSRRNYFKVSSTAVNFVVYRHIHKQLSLDMPADQIFCLSRCQCLQKVFPHSFDHHKSKFCHAILWNVYKSGVLHDRQCLIVCMWACLLGVELWWTQKVLTDVLCQKVPQNAKMEVV